MDGPLNLSGTAIGSAVAVGEASMAGCVISPGAQAVSVIIMMMPTSNRNRDLDMVSPYLCLFHTAGQFYYTDFCSIFITQFGKFRLPMLHFWANLL